MLRVGTISLFACFFVSNDAVAAAVGHSASRLLSTGVASNIRACHFKLTRQRAKGSGDQFPLCGNSNETKWSVTSCIERERTIKEEQRMVDFEFRGQSSRLLS